MELVYNQMRAVIDPMGGQLQSLSHKGKELLRHDARDSWQSTAPVLFPICGALKDDYFIKEGKRYYIPKHGFAQHRLFDAQQLAPHQGVFTLRPGLDDQALYPYSYHLTYTFTLTERGLETIYRVRNTGSEDMYFSIGAHEGYALHGRLEDYTITFEYPETAPVYRVQGSYLDGRSRPFLDHQSSFRLNRQDFVPDALIFRDLRSRRLWLKGPGVHIKLDFADFPYLLIWTRPGDSFVCLEPWCGMPDSVDSDHDLTRRMGIIPLKPGQETRRCHTIEVAE